MEIEDSRGEGSSLWILDVARGVNTRFTFGSGLSQGASWSPNGDTILFASDRNGPVTLFAKNAAGEGQEQQLALADTILGPEGSSPDGAWLMVLTRSSITQLDLVAISLPDGETRLPVLRSEADEAQGRFSPDGSRFAYTSNESGRYEIYVQPFPGPGGKWQVSSGGGIDPQWRGDGKELFYLSPERQLMTVTVDPGPPFRTGAPRALFTARVSPDTATRNRYAATADGERFLVNTTSGGGTPPPIVVVLDWTAGLAR